MERPLYPDWLFGAIRFGDVAMPEFRHGAKLPIAVSCCQGLKKRRRRDTLRRFFMQSGYAANRLHSLSGRSGPRPRSSVSLPFRQLDQFPPENIQRRLIELSSEMPHV